MENMHRLLMRQLKKYGPTGQEIPEEWRRLFKAINDAYEASDEDRRLVEKSMEISSREMFQVNEDLSKKEAALREALSQLQQANRELYEAQEQLVQREKLASIGQLAAGVAHEINNPLSFVSANMQVLEGYIADFRRVFACLERYELINPDNPAAVRAFLKELRGIMDDVHLEHITRDVKVLVEETHDGLDRVKKIVNDLRTFAREDRGELTVVRLDTVIDRALNIAANEVKYKARVLKDYDGDLPPVRCSEHRLGQVFVNLIVNAAQAMEDRGVINIRTYRLDDQVFAEVSDTGKGIPKSDLMRIFDPFFTTKPVGRGTGLGLSVCHEIIKNHDGDIKVSSEVDAGTTFVIRLPAEIRATVKSRSPAGEET